MPDGFVPIDTPTIKGLVIYGALEKCSGTHFYGAWTEEVGTFIGWLRLTPHQSGPEPDAIHAIGEVLGRSLSGTEATAANSEAVDRFREALREAAWDLGVDR